MPEAGSFNTEYEGVVVDNVDPLAKSRLRVFVFGLHDLTGIKMPIRWLPWAFSTQPAGVTNVPTIGSVVKIKYKVDPETGKNTWNPQYIEWSSTSQHNKVKSIKDAKILIQYDNDTQKFFDANEFLTPEELERIKIRLGELEFSKKEKQGQLDTLVLEIVNLENRVPPQLQEQNDLLIRRKSELDAAIKQLEVYKAEEVVLREKLIDVSDKALTDEAVTSWYDNNYTSIDGAVPRDTSLSFDEWEASLPPKTYSDVKNAVIRSDPSVIPVFNEATELAKTIKQFNTDNTISNAQRAVDAAAQQVKISSDQYQASTLEAKKAVQADLDKVSREIIQIDKEIDQLKSSKPSGQNSLASFEECKSRDERIKRLDPESGKIYGLDNTGKEVVIGNWNGARCFIPGYAGQIGDPLWQLATNKNISVASRLSPVDPFALARANVTSNLAATNPAIKSSNDNKTWNCDISAETRLAILKKRTAVMQAIQWLRDKIVSAFSVESNSAIGQWVKATIKQLTAMLKQIKKFLKLVNDTLGEIIKITAEIRQVINYILSLPVRLLVLLQDCIGHFFSGLTEAFAAEIPIPGLPGVSFGEVNDLISEGQSTFQAATDTLELTTIAYVEVKAIGDTFEKV